jgi:hypothetical protein
MPAHVYVTSLRNLETDCVLCEVQTEAERTSEGIELKTKTFFVTSDLRAKEEVKPS